MHGVSQLKPAYQHTHLTGGIWHREIIILVAAAQLRENINDAWRRQPNSVIVAYPGIMAKLHSGVAAARRHGGRKRRK